MERIPSIESAKHDFLKKMMKNFGKKTVDLYVLDMTESQTKRRKLVEGSSEVTEPEKTYGLESYEQKHF